MSIGAGLSLTMVDQKAKSVLDTFPSHKTGVFGAVVEMLRWFAGPQIRNVAVSVCITYGCGKITIIGKITILINGLFLII